MIPSLWLETKDLLKVKEILGASHGAEGTATDNLAFSCAPCNRFKGSRITVPDPEMGRYVRLFHRRRQKWERHFVWYLMFETRIRSTPLYSGVLFGGCS